MITPIEIQKTEFKVGAHGYSKKEVDDFKARVLKDYEALYRQNLDLNDHIADLEDKLTSYNNLEKSLQKALILAEKSAEETKKAAEERAEAIELWHRLRLLLQRQEQNFTKSKMPPLSFSSSMTSTSHRSLLHPRLRSSFLNHLPLLSIRTASRQ